MIGKIILWILAALFLLLILILWTPVRVRAAYDQGDLTVKLRFGPVKLQIFPRPERVEKPEKKPESQPKKKKEKPEKTKAKINREQIFYALEKLPPIFGRVLKRTGKSIRIEPLKVYVLVAGYDPADTALLYGRLEAALAVGLPALRKAVKVRDEDVRLYVDFSERQVKLIAAVGVMLRPWSLAAAGVRALGSLIKWYLGFRKLASPLPPAEPKAEENVSEAA